MNLDHGLIALPTTWHHVADLMTKPTVSIIVPTYQRPVALAACLDSIERTVDIAHEVICVAVEGDRPSLDAIGSRKIRTVVQPTRGGAVQAMNMGFGAAQGEFVIQINDDCELLPHSIANAVRFLQAPAQRHIGQAAFFHDSPVRRNVHAQIQVEGSWYFVCHVRGLCYANFGMTRRTLHEQLGHLDERYFMYGADPDFSLKVWHEAKLRVEPCPGALIHHAELADERASAERAGQHADNQKLFAKWGL
jgi:GT2 family glycosyltransferase